MKNAFLFVVLGLSACSSNPSLSSAPASPPGVLGGCYKPNPPAYCPVFTDAQRAEAMRDQNEADQIRSKFAANRREAEAACNARSEMAEAAYVDRSLLGLDAVMAGARTKSACLEYFRATGKVPGI